MEEYNADAEIKWLTEMLERRSTKPQDVAMRLQKLKVYVEGFADDMAAMKDARVGLAKINAQLEVLEPEVAHMREETTALQSSQQANKELTDLTGQLRATITRQCERLRLQRSDDLPPPFNNMKSIQEITRDRENEITIATKQLRELKMILQMMRQHEEDLKIESEKLIREKTAEKDADILHVTLRCLREREQLLEDTKALKMDIDAIEQHLRAGHYENKQRKEQRLRDYKTQIQRDYGAAGAVAAFDEPSPTRGEDLSPMRFEDKFEAILRKDTANEPTGLQFEDKTRLCGVLAGSPGEKSGFTKFVGRRVTHVNGQEIKPGLPLRLSGLTEATVRFDMDTEHLRCSTMKNEDDDPFKQFEKKESTYKDPYKDLEASTAQIKKDVLAEKQNVDKQQKRLREYQQAIVVEKTEKEREIRKLTNMIASTRQKQAEYEAESQRLFLWMEESQKKLEGLKGKTRLQKQNARMVAEAPETKKIAAAPAREPKADKEEEPAAEPEPEPTDEPEPEPTPAEEEANGTEDEY